MELLGLRTFMWPGKHFEPNLPYQFVEDEYMLADEYDEFLANPSDFVVRKMMPRMAETLEPFGLFLRCTGSPADTPCSCWVPAPWEHHPSNRCSTS